MDKTVMLAQTAGHPGFADSTRVIIWSGVLLGLLILAFAIISKVKRRLKDEVDRNPTASSGFTLADLRQMHREGLLSDAELEKAKAKIVQAARKAAGREDDAKSSAGGSKASSGSDEPPMDLSDEDSLE
jgi:hypothetical protein